MSKRIVFCTFGSLGDLHPILALGKEAKRRGHDAVIATSPAYRQRVEAVGLRFHPVRPDIDCLDPAILRRAMHPTKGAVYIFRELVLPYLRDSYEDIIAIAADADLIVTHPVAVSAFLFARKSGMPWASVALAPVSMASVYDMPVFPAVPCGEWLAGRSPAWQRFLLKMFERMYEPYWKPFRDFEHELGLPRSRNPLLFGHSPQLALALFSPLFGAPQADWPPNSHATGFPFLAAEASNPPELQHFLDEGDPPIVFTLGSAAVGAADDFYAVSMEVAQRLGRRAVLLIGNDQANRPRMGLPYGIIAVPYAPHSAVFPRACVNVHQGGIGTTGEAMRAGRPMLVVPYTHDQPDNAYRVKKLGIARSLPRSRYNADRAVREVQLLLTDRTYIQRAAEVGERIRAERGTEAALELLEKLLENTATRGVQRAAEMAQA